MMESDSSCVSGGCSTGCGAIKPTPPSGAPPSAREMVRISLGLTVICLVSAVILGGLYSFTEPVKNRHALERESKSLRSLLEVPESGSIDEIRRYLTEDLEPVYLTSRFLLRFDENGKEKKRLPIPSQLLSQNSREKLDQWARAQEPSQYMGRFFVGRGPQSEILGFVIEGGVTGYKSAIRFFVATDEKLDLRGIEILEQEEDPGLGGEISKPYFKNQFAGRKAGALEPLRVVKDPQSLEWRTALESLGPTPFSAWIQKNKSQLDKNPVIYAITGATISSESVSQGVKKTLANFKKRLELLREAL